MSFSFRIHEGFLSLVDRLVEILSVVVVGVSISFTIAYVKTIVPRHFNFKLHGKFNLMHVKSRFIKFSNLI